ncbi:diguanylate cyclase domain-containing protein [Thermodesulfobacteriota bacterium]
MGILIVDDVEDQRLLLQRYLNDGGLTDIMMAGSAVEVFNYLGIRDESGNAVEIDLILMDIIMPEVDGIEVCRRIQAVEELKDIPIIMVTVKDEVESLNAALESGAIDYLSKPVNRVELLARVRTGLRLKQETDRRKDRERVLEERNHMLERLSFLDGLTGIANRRYFDTSSIQEWRRAGRESKSIGLIMLDIDWFKSFNDHYGHQKGDYCLKKVAAALSDCLKRPGDFVARYGGEEFAVLLPDTDTDGAIFVADSMRKKIAELAIPHAYSKAHKYVTVSLGAGSIIPNMDMKLSYLISMVDRALYQAKREGRNRVKGIDETDNESD